MTTSLSLLKRFMVLFLISFTIFLLPTFLYVIIILSVRKILQLCSRAYYFRYKIYCNSLFSPSYEENIHACVKIFQEREVIRMDTKNLVS